MASFIPDRFLRSGRNLPPELEELVERQEFWTALETVREPADLNWDQRRLFEVLDVAWPE